MRFHVLGVSFAPTNREYSCEGFSQKVRLFCKMMYNRGHVVYHYGIEGSNPICTENINVVSRETYEKIHKRHDYKKDGFIYFSENEAQDEFNFNTIIEIYKRKQVNDFLCFSFGFPQRPIYDAHSDLIATEIGIGFDGSFTPNRIFESYAWMHCIYGKEGNLNSPNLYDAVIPNYYDLDDYIYSEEKDNYFFFIARMNSQKGLDIAIKCAEYVGCKLLTAGTGTPQFESDNLIHLGVVDFEQRAKLMSRAKATFVTSKYVEPYGSTVVESLLCGTPVISTDIGAFTENVIHGKVGYRCKTMEHFYWATKNIHNIKPIDCRNYAVNNFEINRIGLMYEEYFKSLQNSKEHDSWWQNDINRKNLDYLNKYIPEKNEIKNKKQILCILAGYTPELNDNNINKYNSEFSVIKLAESLTKYYNVYIFGNEFTLNRNINGVEYSKFSNFDSFQKNNNIKTIILFRYMFNFLESEILSENIFLWSYDDIILPYYNGLRFINNGKYLLKNIIDNINGVIVRSEEHKTNFKNFYDISDNNIFIIKDIISYNEESISEWYNLLQNKFK